MRTPDEESLLNDTLIQMVRDGRVRAELGGKELTVEELTAALDSERADDVLFESAEENVGKEDRIRWVL